MSKSIEKFLEFNGKRISILAKDGIWYVALRPVCEALGLSYKAAHKNVIGDTTFSPKLTKMEAIGADKRMRQMVFLPEHFAYAWLLSLNSSNPQFIEYKTKCSDILYDYFRGALSGRISTLNEKAQTDIELMEWEKKLQQTEEYKQVQKLKSAQKKYTKKLSDYDSEIINKQLNLDL